MAKKVKKTNAIRILDDNKINYNTYEYHIDDGKSDGVAILKKLDKDNLYKTLITVSDKKQHYVFIIPINRELDFKKCAKAAGEKRLEMLNLADLTKLTGYVRGGCSPLGMKKVFPTIIDSTALNYEMIAVSAGRIGFEMELDPRDFTKLLKCKFEDVIS